jgi:hypothetical protein
MRAGQRAAAGAGHEPMQRKHLEYMERSELVPSLQHLSRCTIRQAMGKHLPKVGKLPVPNNVKNYILLGFSLFPTSFTFPLTHLVSSGLLNQEITQAE